METGDNQNGVPGAPESPETAVWRPKSPETDDNHLPSPTPPQSLETDVSFAPPLTDPTAYASLHARPRPTPVGQRPLRLPPETAAESMPRN